MEQYTTEQLKVIGFDLISTINNAQQNLQAVQGELNKRIAQTPLPETVTATEEPKEA